MLSAIYNWYYPINPPPLPQRMSKPIDMPHYTFNPIHLRQSFTPLQLYDIISANGYVGSYVQFTSDHFPDLLLDIDSSSDDEPYIEQPSSIDYSTPSIPIPIPIVPTPSVPYTGIGFGINAYRKHPT